MKIGIAFSKKGKCSNPRNFRIGILPLKALGQQFFRLKVYCLTRKTLTGCKSRYSRKSNLRYCLRSYFGVRFPPLDILQAVGISGSTWNKEKMLLQNTGLVESQVTRELAESGVVRKMEFKLTLKGRQVAQNLLAITSLIGDESFASEKIENVLELIVKA